MSPNVSLIPDVGSSVPPRDAMSRHVPLCMGLMLLAVTSSSGFQQAPVANAGNPSTLEDFRAGDIKREPFQKATELLAALDVAKGDWVADVGAGAGYYSMRLSEMVGPDGKVFAEDISNAAMEWLSARVRVFNLRNMEVVKGESNDPKLATDRLAGVLIVDTYHHFTDYPAMLDKVFHALKPGGRLVIADYGFVEHRARSRSEQVKLHEIDPALVQRELTEAGFAVSKCEDPFVKWVPGVGNTRSSATDLWLIVAVRPK
jgi:predicted methyltransferase